MVGHLGTGVLLAALLAGLAPAPASARPPPEPVVERADCGDLGFAADAFDPAVTCGWLTVAETSAPNARMLRLPFVRAAALEADGALEPVLYLHGGPGISVLDVVPRALKGQAWPRLRRRHDLIFLDYRGVGRSTPALCPDFGREMEALSREGTAAEAAVARRVAAASSCRAELLAQGADLSAYGADALAGDAEALRAALRIPRWAVFATSYGVFPAAELMRGRPGTLSAVILDSAFPPDSPNRFEQLNATAEALAALQARCDAQPACAVRHPDIRAAAARVADRLDARPLALADRRVTGETFNEAVWTVLVDSYAAAYLPELISRLEAGDPVLMRRFIETFGRSDVFGGYAHAAAWLANCHDLWPEPTAPAVARAMTAHPDLARGQVADGQDQVCAAFGAGRLPETFYRPIGADTPTLIFFGEFDPATPRSDAHAARDGLGRVTLVEVAGASHAPFYADDCTRGLGEAFLAEPEAVLDLSCVAARPLPSLHDPAAFDAFVATLKD
jgi:pimeloyl-ACP methyl ester carboxylesterase